MRRVPVRARIVFAVMAAALVAAVLAVVTGGGGAMTTFSARFATAPGLYPGNQVRILGLPVGQVTKVTPGPSYVTVVMELPSGTHVPADAQALIMAPQVVNDRYVQLEPAYTGGPQLTDGAVIPETRTATAISVDEVIASLDNLAKALGPTGTNANG
ncbi:MAG TPA: MlaD family protein, partial [Acidimicrobiales bacterium]|nr:MlaD family protein [Acidimicrobiales bacterium]